MFRRTPPLAWLPVAAGLLLTPAAALAQLSPDAILERLEKLEKANERLEKRNERLEKINEDLLRRVDTTVRPAEEPVAAGGAVEPKSVEKIVADYLKRQEADKKKADAAKSKEFQEVGSDLNFKGRWNSGIVFDTPLKDFRVHVGGRAKFDSGWFDADPITLPRYDDAAGFRRARLTVDGSAYEVFGWVVEFDFANPDADDPPMATFTDVYVTVNQLPFVGTFKAGHFKVPFSMEELTSDNYVDTIERSTPHAAFVPSRRLGVGLNNTYAEQRGTWATGIFRNTRAGDAGFDKGDGEYLYAGRVTFLPFWQHDGRCLLHLGAAYVHTNYNIEDKPLPRYSARIPVRLGTPLLLDTGSTATKALATADSADLYGLELAGNLGSASFMSELYLNRNNNQKNNAIDPAFWGWYAQVSYFLTGEYRPYNRVTGSWDRVKPNENFFLVRGEDGSGPQFGRGAWELVARYGYLDLSTPGFVIAPTAATKAGGTGIQQDITLGVNWYWNPNMHVMMNYVHAHRDSDTANRSGDVDALAMRFHWDF